MNTVQLLSSALLAVALVGACTRTTGTLSLSSTHTHSDNGDSVQVTSHSRLDGATELRELSATVPEGATSNVLKFDTREIEQGTIVVRVIAPDGTKKVEKTLGMPERREHEFVLEKTAGEWRLELEMQGARGSYLVNWHAGS